MKKIFAFVVAFVLLLTVLLSLASCSSSGTAAQIDFNKKYILDLEDGESYYVFKSDNTGYVNVHSKYENEDYPSYNHTLSGRVDFEWREASDGAVYLFEVEAHYNEDHTEGKDIYIIKHPIYFGEDFFAYTSSGSSGNTTRYIKEGSKLEEALED